MVHARLVEIFWGSLEEDGGQILHDLCVTAFSGAR